MEQELSLPTAMRYMAENQDELARTVLLRLVADYPESAEISFHCGCVHDRLGLEREAIPYYRRALELGLSPDLEQRALLQLGSSLRCIGEYDQAANVLRGGLERYPENGALAAFLAITLHNTGAGDQAVERLLLLLAETSADPMIAAYRSALTFYAKHLHGDLLGWERREDATRRKTKPINWSF